MTHTYDITGMTCNGCVAKVKSELLKMGDVTTADVQLAAPQATITMQRHISLPKLQEALSRSGNFRITESAHHEPVAPLATTVPESNDAITSYKPLLLVLMYILLVTLLSEVANGIFDWHRWMTNFMAGFFLTFSFFKMLDLRGFADSYATYDVVAKRWHAWGYVYAFIELALGIAYLLRFNPLITNGVTFVVMSISIIGVLQSVWNKRKIQCACLGTVFNLPMTTVTIIEDGLMIAMSAIMIAIAF